MASIKKNAEENNSMLANGGQVTEEKETFMSFLYNKNKKTVLGRTGESWLKITVFYIIFYALLAAFWIGCLAIFLGTLDARVPRFYGKGTIIGVNPGLGYQPWLEDDPDTTLIKYNLQVKDSHTKYTNKLKKYLEKYSNVSSTRPCTAAQSNSQMSTGDDQINACRFDLKVFENGCSAKNEYGYAEGKPCVLISLNRLIGWKPVDYPAESVPEQVRDRYKKGSIALKCDGAYESEQEVLGSLSYLPPHGLDGRYFPYVFVDNFHQSVAMVKFNELPKNRLVIVECRAYALNIEHDSSNRLGLIRFEIFLEDHKPEAKEESR